MATNTYVALKTSTVSVATPTVTINSIPSEYTDLVLVMSGSTSGSINNTIRVGNGSVDTGSNYSCTILTGNGTTATSTRRSNDTSFQPNYNGYTTTGQSQMIVQFQNYSNTSVYKTMISRSGNAATGVDNVVGLWRSTSAIDTIQLLANGGYNWQVGTTFTVYGVAASSIGAKATGGTVFSDASYFYHVFTGNGTFTPSQSISADVLVVAGGGGGAHGGGGAGGLLAFTSQSLTATGYTVTVGAGGAGSSSAKGTNGADSQFGALTLVKGGGGAGIGAVGLQTGLTGGSGGGAAPYAGGPFSGGSATSGQGNAGGTSGSNSGFYTGGGGGGAGAAALTGNSSTGVGVGGIGLSSAITGGVATGVGQNVGGTYYLAGGGGAGSDSGSNAGGSGGGGAGSVSTSTAGTTNTGGGGGGSSNGGAGSANGGSGVVIVRYAK